MRTKTWAALALALALILSACGGATDSGTVADGEVATPADTDPAPTAEAEPTAGQESDAEATDAEATDAEATEAEATEAEAPAADATDAPPERADADLVIWTDDARAALLQDIGDQFAADNGLTVAVQQLDFGRIRDDLVTQGPAGEGPDVIVGAHDWLGKLVTNGAVAPLELGEASGDYEPIAIEALTYDGQVYGLPYAIENIALFRNTELAPEAPVDWDDMIATGQALVDAGDADLPLALQVGPDGDPFHFYPLQRSFGGGVFARTDDGYDAGELLIDSEGSLAFGDALAEWTDAGVIDPDVTFDIAQETFASGRAPYAITGPWNVEPFTEAGIDFSVEEIPSPGGEPASPFVGVQAFMVSAFAENPLVANDFVLNYLNDADVMRELYETGQRPPALTSLAEEVSDDPIIAGFGAVGADGDPLPAIPAMDAVWSEWGAAERDIMLGQGGSELLSQAAERIRDQIDS